MRKSTKKNLGNKLIFLKKKYFNLIRKIKKFSFLIYFFEYFNKAAILSNFNKTNEDKKFCLLIKKSVLSQKKPILVNFLVSSFTIKLFRSFLDCVSIMQKGFFRRAVFVRKTFNSFFNC